MSFTLALEWAALGHRVLPVNGKRPAIKAWQTECTTDPAVVELMWASHPNALVGIATGEPGYDVLDFDVAGGKPGLEQLEKLLDSGILIPGTFMVVATPSGGRHLYFRGTNQRNKQNEKSIPGVDFRGVGGMVLAAGNPGYRWVSGRSIDHENLKQVDWLAIAACLAPEEQPTPAPNRTPLPATKPTRSSKLEAPPKGNFDNAPGEESPLDWYCRQHNFADVLFADGWQYAYTDAEGRQCYTRPGKHKRDGISGNVVVNPDGRETFINRSTTVDWLPTDRAMSVAQYMAYRDHGGDVRAAAGQIRKTMMPQRYPVSTGANQQAQAGIAGGAAAPVAPEGTRSAEVVPASEVGTPEPVKQFWGRRPELREMWYKAQLGGVSPWAVLGNALANVAGRVGPHVCLPPLGGVGAPASLNLLVAISGNTGLGKGRSGQVAREFMGPPFPPQRKPGTGQGIAAMFTEQTKEGPVQSNDTVVLNVAEITQLGAHMSQQGATITSTLLEVYMGEELGEHYANKELRRPVREGHYRLALVAGVQPDNSHIIFDHAASGLPQRFVWFPAIWLDSVLPEGILEPPPPGSEQKRWRAWSGILPGSLDDTIDGTAWSPTDAIEKPKAGGSKEPSAIAVPVKDPYLVRYAPAVQREIQRDHSRRLNLIKTRMQAGEDDVGDPDSHLLLTRAKVASLLAIWLDFQAYVSDEMWELARWVIWVSNDTRGKAQARLTRKAADKNLQRAAGQLALREAVSAHDDRTHNATYIKACDRLLAIVRGNGDWTPHRVITQKMSSREKKVYRESGIEVADVLNDLVIAGRLEAREVDRSGNSTAEWKAK